MKNGILMKLISVLLVLVMVLGIVPMGLITAAEAVEATQAQPVKIDFIDFAKRASQQIWWSSLRASNTDGIRMVGSNYNVDVSLTERIALSQLQAFASKDGWKLLEGDTAFTNKLSARKIYFNSDPESNGDYGLRFYGMVDMTDSRSKLMFSVEVPVAGLYHFNMSVLNEAVTSQVKSVDGTLGRGVGDIYVNDKLVYKEYPFQAYSDTVENVSFGAVELKKGTNTVTINIVKDHFGVGNGTNSGRRCCNLRSIEFIPLSGVQVGMGRTMELDLRKTYLPFDAVVTGTTYTVRCDDSSIVKAKFDADGDLLLTGLRMGETTTVTVYDGDTIVCSFPVEVVEPTAPDNGTFYTLDELKALTLSYGNTAEGDVTYYVDKVCSTEEQVRTSGAVYFKSNDKQVVTVDQETGDITAVGEGSTNVTAYVLMDGVITSDAVIVTVVDETDLESVEVTSEVGFVGVDTVLQMHTTGRKASGGPADMKLYPVVWSVDGGNATITEDGWLTGVSEGTVTVTATAGVDGVPVSGSKTIKVVAGQELAENDVIFDFTYSRVAEMKTATIATHGIEINRNRTYLGGNEIEYGDTSGLEMYTGKAGTGLCFDFRIPRSGWYQLEILGKSIYYAGALSNIFVDDAYMGDINFANTDMSTYGEGGLRNAVYLEAGIHELDVLATKYGYQYLGKVIFRAIPDPGEISVELNAKEKLVVGETTDVMLTLEDGNRKEFYLLRQDAVPSHTNYYILSSSNEGVVRVQGNTLTAVGSGTATITAACEVMGERVTRQIDVTVSSGSIVSAEITADVTTVKPTAAPFNLSVVAYGVNGEAMSTLPAGTNVVYECDEIEIAMVDENGRVTIVGNEGSALVTATITEGGNVLTAQKWITVTSGKSEPTIYTYEDRANAQANTSKFLWAYQMKSTATKAADLYVENLDTIYNMWLFDDLPRCTRVGYKNEVGYRYCRYCNADLVATWGNYPWIVDPLENPWKITCPACKRDFPSNDFESYLKSGMGEDGRFHRENADPQYLVNELYPEMGEGWGVDDGLGYNTGEVDAYGSEVVHTYIGYYMAGVMYGIGDYDKHSLTDIIRTLTDAYIYSGKTKYGVAGAILVDRIADIYPTYDIAAWPDHHKLAFSDGGGGRGKFIGCIWDAILSQYLAKAVDAFWPCADHADVISYLQQDHILKIKGLEAEDITPEYIRTNAENGILLEAYKCATTDYYNGNFGMEEAGISYAAVCLDRQPETTEMIKWVFHEEKNGGLGQNSWNTGGDVNRVLTEDVSRDGFGYEVSYLYNSLWTQYLLDMADALHEYPDAAEFDLWNNPKFVNMYTAFLRLTVCGHLTPQVGEAGFVQSTHNQIGMDKMLTAFLATGDPVLAQGIYAANGNSVDGLHGNIFLKDPTACQAQIKSIVAEQGEWNFSASDMMSGFGIAILREGPARYTGKTGNAGEFFDYWMYFGYSNTAHACLQALAIDMEAFGIGVSSGMGYPTEVISTGHERMQWTRNTSSKNTVVVDDLGQSVMEENGQPMHFEDAERVKIMDAQTPEAYPQTDIYRRTLVTVAAENGVHYAVDFFRVLGGSEHVYSFHGATTLEPKLEGLNMTRQPMGTYEGPDVPFGFHVTNEESNDASTNAGSGYSWLDDVWRDDSPETYFSVDWEIEDFHKQLANPKGIHLKLHMLSEEPMTEVALADGHPPQTGRNPDHLEYVMIRRSGNAGMDTLFTAIIEPYRNNELIAAAELVDMQLLDGTEGIYDRAAAMKITLVGGREDYVVYASNPECLYAVMDETGSEKFRFCGFTGVCSYENDELVYAYGSEASQITDTNGLGNVIEGALPAVTGTVTDFTKEFAFDYFMTVELDQTVLAEELIGRYVYVENDGVENAAYRIHDVEVDGNTAVLNLNNQDLIRSYVDSANEELGYVFNITEGDSLTIPLSQTYMADGSCNHSVVRRAEKKAADAGMHYETVVCELCPRITTNLQPCTDNNRDNSCDLCGAQVTTIQKFDVVGANMTLGNDLKMNFLIKKSDMKDGYVAKVTQTGREPVELQLWNYNAQYYAASYSVAAKEMTDVLSCEIYDAEGYLVSNPFTRTIKQYAMTLLNNASQKASLKSVIVDMLNYGTEAQKYFKYNEDAYANAEVTAEQQAEFATASVEVTNNQMSILNFVGANLSLEDSILLNVFFKVAYKDGLKAEISFTDYKGNVVNAEGEAGKYGSMTKVVVNQVVLADAKRPVTVKLYDGETVVGECVESVESYVARNIENTSTGAINTAIMKFATSAYNYLGGTN